MCCPMAEYPMYPEATAEPTSAIQNRIRMSNVMFFITPFDAYLE